MMETPDDLDEETGYTVTLSPAPNNTTTIQCHGCGWITVHPSHIGDAFVASMQHRCEAPS